MCAEGGVRLRGWWVLWMLGFRAYNRVKFLRFIIGFRAYNKAWVEGLRFIIVFRV